MCSFFTKISLPKYSPMYIFILKVIFSFHSHHLLYNKWSFRLSRRKIPFFFLRHTKKKEQQNTLTILFFFFFRFLCCSIKLGGKHMRAWVSPSGWVMCSSNSREREREKDDDVGNTNYGSYCHYYSVVGDHIRRSVVSLWREMHINCRFEQCVTD
jgi:hypothetical protein